MTVVPPNTLDSGRAPNTARRRVGVATLGCKINAFESELVAQALQGGGWDLVDAGQEADLYVINTCTVTREADRQARQAVRRVIRRNPDALVVVTGCYAQMDPESCARIPGVDLVLGNDRKLDLHKLLPQLEGGALPAVLVGDLNEHVSLPSQLVHGFEGHTRAFVQVQQGCDQSCTFCIIHRARGPSRSLRPGLITRQVERLVLAGYREMVICGVDLGSYGADLAGDSTRLAGLLRRLAAIEGDFRLRLSSIDPAHLDDELIEVLAGGTRLCPHLHLSLQSGDTLILKRMKRRYTADDVYARVAALRNHVPNLVLSADVMVGFPTETEAQYEATEQMVESLEVAYPHVFVYSERDGTPAARIPAARQVPMALRRERSSRLRATGRRVVQRVLKDRIGTIGRVLIEGGGRPPPGRVRARRSDYLPVYVPEHLGAAGDWLDVRCHDIAGQALLGRSIV